MKELYEKNKKILNDIEGKVASKTTTIYNSMKPKIAAGIFNKMIDEGKIDDVFAIILKLKEKKVDCILVPSVSTFAAILTEMLQNYKIEE